MSDTATVEPEQAPGLITVPEAARRLGIDKKTLRKSIGLGEVKAVRLSSAVRVPLAEVERLLAAKT